ncbi:MAG: Lrp/AsnC ligand binding domain-containing protein [Nitrosopumilaceae archaeon]
MPIAYILINCNIGEEESVKDQLQSIEGVKDVQQTFGAYDIVIKVELPTAEKLRDIIAWKIRKIQEIRSTLTMMSAEIKKKPDDDPI